MRIPGAKRVGTFSKWIQARILGGALILGYHRITSTPGAYPELCVSPENFAEHLHVLRKHTKPMHLAELVRHLKDGCLPERSVAITFDDGYADNLYGAKPLLEEFEIPATVFACTGYTGKEFWWDELARLIANARKDRESLVLEIKGKKFRWNQGEQTPGSAEPRGEFPRGVYHFLLRLDPEDQYSAMDMIRNWSDAPSFEETLPRALTQDEILTLVDGRLVELGAHTSHHPMLPSLSLERQKEEIESSKRDLEALLGYQIAGFAYPNGGVQASTRRLVRESGFVYACTSLHDVVRPGNDMFGLTRFWQQNVHGDRFAKRLKRWMYKGVHR